MEYSEIYFQLALIFGFLMACGIGANDVSNAMGTSVGSKALTLTQAILVAVIFEFAGATLAGGSVTSTVGQSIVNQHAFNNQSIYVLGMLASLLAAGTWLLIATFMGWPISTTHTIIGAIIGFSISEQGYASIQWESIRSIFTAWLASPFIGGTLAYITFMSIQKLILRKKYPLREAKEKIPYYIGFIVFAISFISMQSINSKLVNISGQEILIVSTFFSIVTFVTSKLSFLKTQIKKNESKKKQFKKIEVQFSVLMIITACTMAFAHGSNDIANAIGPLHAVTKIIKPNQDYNLFIALLGGSGIVLGLVTYGYRVIKTIGSGITELTPTKGFAATFSTAITVVLASNLGMPISTTHTLVGAILGIGLAGGIEALNLKKIGNIFVSWIITLPAGAISCVLFLKILKSLFVP